MKLITRILIISQLFIIISFQTLMAGTIDGPANIRIKPNGKIMASLNDKIFVNELNTKNNWYKIHFSGYIRNHKNQSNKENEILLINKKGYDLFNDKGKIIG